MHTQQNSACAFHWIFKPRSAYITDNMVFEPNDLQKACKNSQNIRICLLYRIVPASFMTFTQAHQSRPIIFIMHQKMHQKMLIRLMCLTKQICGSFTGCSANSVQIMSSACVPSFMSHSWFNTKVIFTCLRASDAQILLALRLLQNIQAKWPPKFLSLMWVLLQVLAHIHISLQLLCKITVCIFRYNMLLHLAIFSLHICLWTLTCSSFGQLVLFCGIKQLHSFPNRQILW